MPHDDLVRLDLVVRELALEPALRPAMRDVAHEDLIWRSWLPIFLHARRLHGFERAYGNASTA